MEASGAGVGAGTIQRTVLTRAVVCLTAAGEGAAPAPRSFDWGSVLVVGAAGAGGAPADTHGTGPANSARCAASTVTVSATRVDQRGAAVGVLAGVMGFASSVGGRDRR